MAAERLEAVRELLDGETEKALREGEQLLDDVRALSSAVSVYYPMNIA